MYELFEHTADLGLRVRAPDLDTLFQDAARGLFAMIVENLDEVQPTQALNLQVNGEERDYLLFDWLNELLFAFDTGHLVLAKFDVKVSPTGLEATAWGEKIDPERHRLDHEVKAITYHELRLEQEPDGWLAEVIVDI